MVKDRVLLRRIRHASQRGLLYLSKGPRYMLAFAAWYASYWARKAGVRKRPWCADGSAIWAQLDLGSQSMAESGAVARHGIGDRAAQALLDYFAQRQKPRFFVRWDDRASLVDMVPAEARARTIEAANQVVQQTFCFRGQPPVTFDGRMDWTHRPQGNTDWMWDLNRHTYWTTLGQAFWYTGDRRYSETFAHQLTDWLWSNPPSERQPNWSSPFEVACRINTWLWAYHLFSYAGALDAGTHLKLLRGLWTHGAYLDTCLESHVPNNHLLLEAKALAMLGLLLPEFRSAHRWRTRGLSILEREMRRQVCSDGVHAERVPFYHHLIAGELLELLVLLDENSLAPPPALVDGLRRMAEFEHHLTRPDRQLPLFGDSAYGDPYSRFSPTIGTAALLGQAHLKTSDSTLDEMTAWLLGPQRIKRLHELSARPPYPSRAFPEGGYAVMRTSWQANSLYLVLDCGPFGYRPSPGHGHADALSIEVCAGEDAHVIDPGVYSFHLGEHWRNTFRSTCAHNTVVVDGQDQSVLLDSWHVWRPARVTLHDWMANGGCDFADASHDGYRRLPGRVVHRRQVFFAKPEYWILLDLLDGRGRHRFDLYFHLSPDAEVLLDRGSGQARIKHFQGTDLLICPASGGDLSAEVVTGWVSLRSGARQAASTLRYTRVASAPAMFQTVLYPCSPASDVVKHVSPLAVVDADKGTPTNGNVTGLQVETDSWVDYLVVDRRALPNWKHFGEYASDGQLVYVREQAEDRRPVRAVLHRGHQLTSGGMPWVTNDDAAITCVFPSAGN